MEFLKNANNYSNKDSNYDFIIVITSLVKFRLDEN